MYNEFFGFEKNPFVAKPDPACFYRSKQHDASLRGLVFAVQARMGLISLTGEEGTGKSTVLECLHESLESNNIRCAFLRESRISANRFFQVVASDLELQCKETSAYQVFSALHQLLIEQARKGRTVALLVDDAHNLPGEIFNEILHLSSLHDDKVKLLQTVLTGRPELHSTLDALNLERLKQRAILNCTLHPFAAGETKEYIEFRLAQAGMPRQTFFSAEAIAEIHDRSGGFAPAIHALCESLLLAAFSASSKVCTPEILDQVLQMAHGKSKILEASGTVVAVTRIDLGRLAPSEPEPPPMQTALLRVAFDLIPGLPPPLPRSSSALLAPQVIVLGVMHPFWKSTLRVVGLTRGLKKTMRLADAANAAPSILGHFDPLASSPAVLSPAMFRPTFSAEPRSSRKLKRLGAKNAATIWSPSAVLATAIDFPGAVPHAPNWAVENRNAGAVRVATPVPLEGAMKPRPQVLDAQPGALSPIPCAILPANPASKLQPAGGGKLPRVPLKPFRMKKSDSPSPMIDGDVQAHPVHPGNPVTELAIPHEPSIQERDIQEHGKPLLLAWSVPPSPPPAVVPVQTFLNARPHLETCCPPSGLQPVNPRSSFLLLDARMPDTAIAAGKSAPYGRRWLLNVAILIPFGITLYNAFPAIPSAADAVREGWASAHQAMLDRAAVAFNEDFRAGLDDWVNRAGARPSWASDAAGFVHPGALALFRPSLSLADYQMQFVGTIDTKGLSWVVRAADFNNYYAVRLTVLKPGPTPAIGVTRYAVIAGKIENQVTTPVQMSARRDTVYRVSLDVQGDRYALSVQDQLVDSWTEPKLRQGGIGFFSEQDAASRVAAVQIKGQYDLLGRLYALMAPAGVSSHRASLNKRAGLVLTAEAKPRELFSSSPAYLGRRRRGSVPPLDPVLWQAPEVAISKKTKRCPSPAITRAGAVRTRRASSFGRSEFSEACY